MHSTVCDAVVTMKYKLSVAITVVYVTALVSNYSYARNDGRFADSPLKEWFDRLASGNGLCCSFADGFSVRS